MTLEILAREGTRAYPPRVSAFTQPFWQGLAEGIWQSTGCEDCGRATFPPKPICPHCWSSRMQWRPLPERGVLYSWTRVHAPPAVFADQAPYALGIVDLEGGLRIAVRLVEAGAGAETAWTPGMAMRVVALRYADGPLFAATHERG